ncbi:hypothetical protein [Lamprocystis purpurea]|jgi:hypothetical protein|nr:hypothetical protein [Lamprocystis purpurea]
MTEDTCEYCKYPLAGIHVGTGTGLSHPKCYAQNHPPFQATTAEQVGEAK